MEAKKAAHLSGKDQTVTMQHRLEYIQEQCNQMSLYLSKYVQEGSLKDKLNDQLIWLKYQIKCHKCDIDILEENFNWVVSNFNQYLRLNSKERFHFVQIY